MAHCSTFNLPLVARLVPGPRSIALGAALFAAASAIAQVAVPPVTPTSAPSQILQQPLPSAPLFSSSVSGTVEDSHGAAVLGAVVILTSTGTAATQSVQSAEDGTFHFKDVPAGPYKLSVASPGFERWSTSGSLERGEVLDLTEISLALPADETDVTVFASNKDIAEAQLSLAEKQRVLGVIPNFYASYVWNAAPLTRRQKFSLAWKFSTDPVAFFMAGIVAGSEQSGDTFSGYGQGTRGYARRFGATYADGFASTMIGQAILPSLFHQDPRYFVKGTGSVRSRVLYVLGSTILCKGDNRSWQVNYSNILGNVASASISNLYYPASSRHGVGLTVENSLLTTASGAIGGMFQEFLLHRMTPKIPDYGAASHQ